MLVAASIFGLLMSAIFVVYRVGLDAWQKSSAGTEVLQNLQTVMAHLTREAERSAATSLSIDPASPGTGVSFLSATDAMGDPTVDSTNMILEWQKYVVFYWDATRSEILRLEVPLAAPTMIPLPIENAATTSGTQPLSFYRTGGRAVGRFITNFSVEQVGSTLILSLESRKQRDGSAELESQSLRTAVKLRN